MVLRKTFRHLLQPTDMDARIAVPQGAAPLETSPYPLHVPQDLVDPDIFITGEVHLIAPQQGEEKAKWQVITRFSSFAFHVLLFAALMLQSRLFPPHEPTQEEIELARKQLTLLLPPGKFESLKPLTRPFSPPPKSTSIRGCCGKLRLPLNRRPRRRRNRNVP